MNYLTKEKLDELRNIYPKGKRITLLHMDDVQAPPVGTQGTVVGVDDIGQVLVNWDDGSNLNLIPSIDTVCDAPEKEEKE